MNKFRQRTISPFTFVFDNQKKMSIRKRNKFKHSMKKLKAALQDQNRKAPIIMFSRSDGEKATVQCLTVNNEEGC